jgi:ribonuclease HI
MKQTILAIPSPTSTRGVREFLGSAGYCRLWIPGFAEIARPLYEATKEAPNWRWGEREQQAFDQLKNALLQAPALALPDPTRPFTLFVDERKGVAKGVLTQQLGPWKRPVAYLSRKLDAVAAGWPPCLRIIAAIAMLVREADKLTFGQALWVTAPHPVEGILKQPPGKWMTNARLTHYQGLLLDSPRITFTDPITLNPATLLPNPELQTPVHDCKEFLSEVTQARADLKDTPLSSCELNWYTDGSSFVQDGVRRAGAAVVDQEGNTVWSSALPPGTSAQKAELIALAEALERAKGKRVNIYTDSRYAFGTIHVYGAIYHERGFRTAERKNLKNLAEVQRLLMAVEKPKAVAVMYVPGHQSAKTPEAVGNNRADQEAKRAAMVSPSMVVAVDVPVPELPSLPHRPEYSTEDFTWMRVHSPIREGENGWRSDLEGKLILPEKLGRFLLINLHKSTHLGRRKLLDLLTSTQLRFPNQTVAVC